MFQLNIIVMELLINFFMFCTFTAHEQNMMRDDKMSEKNQCSVVNYLDMVLGYNNY